MRKEESINWLKKALECDINKPIAIGKKRETTKWYRKLRNDWIKNKNKVLWEDHYSSSIDGKEQYFEPYGLSQEKIKSLTDFCIQNNLEFEISGYSAWHPNSFSIIIKQKMEI